MKRTFAYGAATNQGLWPVQEDGFFVDPGKGLFVLADGFGGRGNGDIAAKLALQQWRNSEKADRAPRETGFLSPVQLWQRSQILEVNSKLLQWNEKRSGGTRGGCSLIVASIENENELTVTSCGACSAFILRLGRWLPLLPPQAAPRGQPEQALIPHQALGIGKDLHPETRSLVMEKGDLLFLFSSGLSWERDEFQAELMGQMALRLPGSDLGGITALVAEPTAVWNQTALAVEALI